MNLTTVLRAMAATLVLSLTMLQIPLAAPVPPSVFEYAFSADFREGPYTVGGGKARPGLYEYSESRTYQANPFAKSGEVRASVRLSGGVIPMIVAEGKATDVAGAKSLGSIEYTWLVERNEPGFPDIPVPISIRIRGSTWVVPGFNAYLKAESIVTFRTSTSPYPETLVSAFADNGSMLDLEEFVGVRSAHIADLATFSMRAFGTGASVTRGSPGQWYASIDPVISIDPTFTVMVDGIKRLGSEGYSIRMSDGFVAASGEPFEWSNPAGGDFGEAANWRSFPARAVPSDDAHLSFASLPEGSVLSVTLDRPRFAAAIDVMDAQTTLDLGGHRLENAGELRIGAYYGHDPGLLRLKNGALASAGGVKIGLSAGEEGTLQIDADATLEALGVTVFDELLLDGGRIRAGHGDDGMTIAETGLLTGSGLIEGTVENMGLIEPGNTPGAISIDGDFVQGSLGRLALEITGPARFDQLAVTGTADVGGTLEVVLGDGFQPGPRDHFLLIDASRADFHFDEIVVQGGALNVASSPQGLVVSGVPEPKSFVLLALGMIAAIGQRDTRISQFHHFWERR